MAELEGRRIVELRDLAAHRLGDLGAAVAQARAPQAGEAVEDLAAVAVGEVGPLASTIRRGSALNWRLAVKGIQCASSQAASVRTVGRWAGVSAARELMAGGRWRAGGYGGGTDSGEADTAANDGISTFTCQSMKVKTPSSSRPFPPGPARRIGPAHAQGLQGRGRLRRHGGSRAGAQRRHLHHQPADQGPGDAAGPHAVPARARRLRADGRGAAHLRGDDAPAERGRRLPRRRGRHPPAHGRAAGDRRSSTRPRPTRRPASARPSPASSSARPRWRCRSRSAPSTRSSAS